MLVYQWVFGMVEKHSLLVGGFGGLVVSKIFQKPCWFDDVWWFSGASAVGDYHLVGGLEQEFYFSILGIIE